MTVLALDGVCKSFVKNGIEVAPLTQLSVEIAYRYLKNHSNVTVFDYDREITGMYVTYRFDE